MRFPKLVRKTVPTLFVILAVSLLVNSCCHIPDITRIGPDMDSEPSLPSCTDLTSNTEGILCVEGEGESASRTLAKEKARSDAKGQITAKVAELMEKAANHLRGAKESEVCKKTDSEIEGEGKVKIPIASVGGGAEAEVNATICKMSSKIVDSYNNSFKTVARAEISGQKEHWAYSEKSKIGRMAITFPIASIKFNLSLRLDQLVQENTISPDEKEKYEQLIEMQLDIMKSMH